jgi:hypothetical protein
VQPRSRFSRLSGFRCLIPAAPAVPAAAAKQQNDQYDDEKRGGVHGRTPPVPCVFSRFAYALPLQPTLLIPIRSYAKRPRRVGGERRGHLGKRRGGGPATFRLRADHTQLGRAVLFLLTFPTCQAGAGVREAARPLPPSADIGPGGQFVGQAAQFCLETVETAARA